MYIIMDMGTTNTRLYLLENGQPMDSVKGRFGAGFGKKHGRPELVRCVNELLSDLLGKCAAEENQVECILAVGMAGSEIGLWEVPHISVPADAEALAKHICAVRLEGISIPFLFVPGVKKTDGNAVLDMMRGEEVETVGLASLLGLTEDAVFVLPGTHNKIIRVSAKGEILDFCSTFSGELLDSLVSHTILSGQVAHDFMMIPDQVRIGAAFGKENGLNAAVYRTRVLARNGSSVHEASSFLYGCVLGQDTELIRRVARGKKLWVAGSKNLRDVYSILLEEENAVALGDEVCAQMMSAGAMRIKKIYNSI